MKKIFLSSLLALGVLGASDLSPYVVTDFCIQTDNGREYAIIRHYVQHGIARQLAVDTQTLHTQIQERITAPKHSCSPNSRYQKYLTQSRQAPFPLQNDGIVSTSKGIRITTDLCPSSKQGFEKELYQSLIDRFPHPVPITLFITGKWIQKHAAPFRQFQAWEKEGKLSLTWGNHTYAHPYHSKVPLEENFALSKDYNLQQDTLELEKLLISRGVTPSIFFRFPGLVSDQKSIEQIYRLGLIAVGSDTWIAKGEKPKDGSIILLHGNKNEHRGIEMFLPMLHSGAISQPLPLTDL